MAAWKWARARVCGPYHAVNGERAQDACAVFWDTQRNALFMAVADGAGSARHGRAGAILLMRHLARAVRLRGPQSLRDLEECIHCAQMELIRHARERNEEPWQYSTTLACAWVTPDRILCANVGDSVVIARRKDTRQWMYLCEPRNGEYANVTFFLPLRSREDLYLYEYENVSSPWEAICAFTDGISPLGLTRDGIFAPFFDWMLEAFREDDRTGHDSQLSGWLKSVLDSDRIRERSADDKTLIMVSAVEERGERMGAGPGRDPQTGREVEQGWLERSEGSTQRGGRDSTI